MFNKSYRNIVRRAGSPPSAAVSVGTISPGIFIERITGEIPGRLPLGHVVLLGQLSGRPEALVYMYTDCDSLDQHSENNSGRYNNFCRQVVDLCLHLSELSGLDC